MTDMPADVDAALFDAVTRLARCHSRTTVAWLTAQVHRQLEDAPTTAETNERVVETNVDVVGRPDGTVSHLLEAVDSTALLGPKADPAARRAIARHYRRERWWSGSDDLEARPAELTRAIGHAVPEDARLFQRPQHLLSDALEQDVDDHHWGETSRLSVRTPRSASASAGCHSLWTAS